MAGRHGSASAGPALSLQVLDGFRLVRDGDDVALPLSGQRVLGLLALRRRVDRDAAAGTLWPEQPQDRALASLRTAVWRISRLLPRALVTKRCEVALDEAVRVDVDRVLETAAHLRSGGSARALPHLPFLEGELLPGWDEQWILLERERLRQVQLFTLVDVARALAAAGRTAAAVDTAHRALRLEPLRESTYRLLVELHAASGDVAEALRQAEICESLLRHQLGVPLSPMMRRLLEDLSRVADGGSIAPAVSLP